MYAGSNDNILWHFILKKLGKVAYFFKSSCLSKKKTEGTFLRKKIYMPQFTWTFPISAFTLGYNDFFTWLNACFPWSEVHLSDLSYLCFLTLSFLYFYCI